MISRFVPFVWLFLMAPSASANPVQDGDGPLRVDLALDLTLTIGAGTLALVPSLIEDSLDGPWCGLRCDPDSLNALDRHVLGNYSADAALASDVLVGIGLTAPFVFSALDQLVSDRPDGWQGVAVESLVALEALALNNMLVNLTKLAVGRPRPYVYDNTVPPADRLDPYAATSFYSGHTANAFCAATVSSTLFSARHPGSMWTWPVWIGSHLAAAGIGVLRVEAGRHFWTDVLTGAIVGSSVGFVVPYLHMRSRASKTAAEQSDPTGVRVSLQPLVVGGGGGLILRIQGS